MSKEFLKLENKLSIKLKIVPVSPLLIKESNLDDDRKNSTEIKFLKINNKLCLLGSTLKGLFRDRFLTISEATERRIDVDNLFGNTNSEDTRKGRFFIEDSYVEILNDTIKTRSITPIDHFSGKAIVPLQFEYTKKEFETQLTMNNFNIEELKAIYFVLRDSLNGEIRIGNSKTRGFGEIKLEVSDFKYIFYKGKTDILEELKEYFELDKKNSKKIGQNYLYKTYNLKEDYKKINLQNPNKFILALFEGGR